MRLAWVWLRFGDLGADGVYDMLALRARVFVLEQGPFLDPDGADRSAWHLLGRKAGGELMAYLRVLDPGVKYDEVSIGRVVVAVALRGQGVGHALMRQHGFETASDEYLEDGVPHVQMRRSGS